jgi:hypothetical protein
MQHYPVAATYTQQHSLARAAAEKVLRAWLAADAMSWVAWWKHRLYSKMLQAYTGGHGIGLTLGLRLDTVTIACCQDKGMVSLLLMHCH